MAEIGKVEVTPLAKLQAWAKSRAQDAGMQELAYFPGSDREISVEDAASVALVLLDDSNEGRVPTER